MDSEEVESLRKVLLGNITVEGPGEVGDREFFLVPIYTNGDFSPTEFGCWVQTGTRLMGDIVPCLSFARKVQWGRGF